MHGPPFGTRVRVGYHASHEQFVPSELLRLVVEAERAGFQAGMCSDHFAPWSRRQGQSGFSWTWLGAAAQATRLSYGVVCAPVQRYHPAIVAQAAATMEEMFPGRFWLAPGSGEAVNESITGDAWPDKPEREERLEEAVDIVRRLWAGETVTVRSRWFRVRNARLWTRPARPPPLIAAAASAEKAARVARWADGCITVSQPEEKLREVVRAFRANGGRDKPLYLQAKHSWAETDEEALREAHDQWRTNVFRGTVFEDLDSPEKFDFAAEHVRPEDVRPHVRVSSDPERHARWLEEDRRLGFDRVYVHFVGRNQSACVQAFGKGVLPALA